MTIDEQLKMLQLERAFCQTAIRCAMAEGTLAQRRLQEIDAELAKLQPEKTDA